MVAVAEPLQPCQAPFVIAGEVDDVGAPGHLLEMAGGPERVVADTSDPELDLVETDPVELVVDRLAFDAVGVCGRGAAIVRVVGEDGGVDQWIGAGCRPRSPRAGA